MRTNVISLIVGKRGTGKTDFTKDLVKSSHQHKKLIIDTFDNPAWRDLTTWNDPQNTRPIPIIQKEQLSRWENGLYRIADPEPEFTFEILDKTVSNALLTFEDSTRYIQNKVSPAMKRFLYDSKQKNLDCIFVFHSLMSVPPDLIRISDTLTLFKTNEGYPSQSKYPWDEIPKMMDQLKKDSNRYANLTIRFN